MVIVLQLGRKAEIKKEQSCSKVRGLQNLRAIRLKRTQDGGVILTGLQTADLNHDTNTKSAVPPNTDLQQQKGTRIEFEIQMIIVNNYIFILQSCETNRDNLRQVNSHGGACANQKIGEMFRKSFEEQKFFNKKSNQHARPPQRNNQ